MQTVIALVVIFIASQLFVSQLEQLGPRLGISPAVVALLLSPVATELPEIMDAIIWVRQSKERVALVNISGAMMIQATVPSAFGLFFTRWLFGGSRGDHHDRLRCRPVYLVAAGRIDWTTSSRWMWRTALSNESLAKPSTPAPNNTAPRSASPIPSTTRRAVVSGSAPEKNRSPLATGRCCRRWTSPRRRRRTLRQRRPPKSLS